jgi:hypothetical protein
MNISYFIPNYRSRLHSNSPTVYSITPIHYNITYGLRILRLGARLPDTATPIGYEVPGVRGVATATSDSATPTTPNSATDN